MRPHTLCPLGIGQPSNTIEAGIFGRALVQENLRTALGDVGGERGPVRQIARPLDNIAQARDSGVAKLKTGYNRRLKAEK